MMNNVDTIPLSPPGSPKRKYSDVEKEERVKDTQVNTNGERITKKIKRCCNDVECYQERYFMWITYKFRDDPNMLNVTKDRWRVVLHSEFYNLRNFRCWRDNKHNGISNWPHNINDRGWIPMCLFNALERFIDEQFSKQARNWQRQRMNDVEENGNGKERQRLNEMSSEDVEKDFTKMMKETMRFAKQVVTCQK